MMDATRFSARRHDAWLLDLGGGLRAAVGAKVLVQIIDKPELHPLPCTPPYCHAVVSWQGRLLPAMDMAARLGGAVQPLRLLAVAAFQERQEPVRFGALLLDAPPVAIAVGAARSCPLPERPAGWDRFALSCFEHEGSAIPVLHLGRIFGAPDAHDAPQLLQSIAAQGHFPNC